MKRREWKRILSCASAAVMMISVLGGCGKQAKDNETQTSPETAVEESAASSETVSQEITFPLKEQVELTIATEDGTVASLANNLPLWEEIEKRTNIKINWDVTAPAQYVEVMKLRVSAGGELPDVMLLPNGINLGELGSEGRIVPLEGYIETYGDNIKAMYEEFPHVKSLTSADGHIYSINTVSENAYFMPYSFVVRKDWLDRLGLEEPETIEEWVKVLEAFRDEDADGDGNKGNEIPFSVGGHAWYTTFWAHAWDLHLFYSDGWYPDENGKMQYEFISDKAKEFYTWLNKFYEDGLLDPEFLTMGDETKLFEKVSRNEVGAFLAYPSTIPQLEAALAANGVEGAKLVPLVPPKGPYAQMTEILGDVTVNGYVVTESCKNPEVVVALIDYLMSDEGKELMNIGIEGVTYTREADGTVRFTEYVTANPDGLAPAEVLSAFGCQLGLPYIMSTERGEAMLFEYPDDMRERFVEVSEKTRPFAHPTLILPPATEEESSLISGLMGDLATYVWEMTGKFTVGTADIDAEWDNYVSYLRGLGVDQILEVKQAQYDRLAK